MRQPATQFLVLGSRPCDLVVDAPAASIDGILQEFLDDAGRPLDDLAGSDAIDQICGQPSY